MRNSSVVWILRLRLDGAVTWEPVVKENPLGAKYLRNRCVENVLGKSVITRKDVIRLKAAKEKKPDVLFSDK